MSDYSIEIVSVPVVRRRRGLYLQAAEWVAAEPSDAEPFLAQTTDGSPQDPGLETPASGETPQRAAVPRMVEAAGRVPRMREAAEPAGEGADSAAPGRAGSFGRGVFPDGLAVSPVSLSPSAVTRPAAAVAGGGGRGAFGYATEPPEVRAGGAEEWTRRVREVADGAVASALAGLRVYVVESDITEAQRAVRAVVEQSRI